MASNSRGVQALFEKHLEMPAWAMAAFSGVAKAASFYSSGSFSLPRFLGPLGMFWFNLTTGLGLAFALDVVMGISGRQESYFRQQRIEATGRKGISKSERESLIAMFAEKERQNRFFKRMGMGGSFLACVSYFLVANNDHSIVAISTEAIIGALQVACVYYLAVIKESKNLDAHEQMQEQSQALRLRVVGEAGNRIAANAHTDQDIRIYAESLPRRDRAQFLGAFTRVDDGDVLWTSTDIAAWIGYAADDKSARRKIQRRLQKSFGGSFKIVKAPDTGAYSIPKAQAARLFFDEFTAQRGAAQAPAQASDPVLQSVRQRNRYQPQEIDGDSDSDATAAGGRQAGDIPAILPQLVPGLGLGPSGLVPVPVSDQGAAQGRRVELV